MKALVLLLALSACQQIGSTRGPNAPELLASINATPEVSGFSNAQSVRNIRCDAIEEEPTELSCRFEVRDGKGAWTKQTAIVTYERSGWSLLGLE
jgi:hypothetical protein